MAQYAHAQLIAALVRTGRGYPIRDRIYHRPNTGGLIAHAPAMLAAWQISTNQNVFFLGLPSIYRRFAPKLKENEYLTPKLGGLTDYTILALLF